VSRSFGVASKRGAKQGEKVDQKLDSHLTYESALSAASMVAVTDLPSYELRHYHLPFNREAMTSA
jgi:hypothetical protein